MALVDKRQGDRTVVAIDGMSTAGKSTLATAVAKALTDATLIPGDDFYRVMNDETRLLLTPEQGYHEDFDWQRLRDEVLVPLREGRPARYQRYDWSTGELGSWAVVESTRIVIVEGVYVSRPELRQLFDLVIWVEAPANTRFARQAQRDDSPAWVDRWDRAEQFFVRTHDPAGTADLVVTGGRGSLAAGSVDRKP